ncbi:ribokinase [Mesorhizobium sp. M7A.F.Ca.US.006.01.1.1]|uniref:ribokinase n=1 Tax=Mesorhizobium sp. M7A.F.Ca.US.006.01.1.1 TaxID=2496707 RepID=UPI000FCB69C5|nr:ribokinase [Mesorhizobium sp. M7A.F.Ca.US.006.01.1.1]RUZ77877.1 ribokinase [Mesorhizobium sp. M7A.F.Ca.US.006.01.1.1]
MIVVIGSINLDLVASVESLPCPGETVPGSAFVTAGGGKGANQALAAARAGAQVRMIGAVGNDSFASDAMRLLKEAEIDLSGVRKSTEPTGTALILVDPRGENIITVVPGANATVVPDALPDLRQGELVLLQHEIPLSTVKASLKAARQAKAISILNTAPFRAEAANFLTEADYVVANETEFDHYSGVLQLSGGDRASRMTDYVRKYQSTIIVTLGGEGALCATPETFFECPALKIEPIDTVGAGDTFCGYLAHSLSLGASLETAVQRANVAAALACLSRGAQPSIPYAKDVAGVSLANGR